MKCSAVFLIILNIIFALCGIVLAILGIVFYVNFRYPLILILLVLGLFVVALSILGCCGARSGEETSCQRVSLYIYFYVILVIFLLLMLVSTLFLFSREYLVPFVQHTVKFWITVQKYKEWFEKLGDGYSFCSNVSTDAAKYIYVTSFIGYGIAAVFIVGLVFTICVLSLFSVIRSSFVVQNIILCCVGGLLAGVTIAMMISDPFLRTQWYVIVLLIAGIFVALISFMGCLGACCKTRCFVITYAIVLGAITVAIIFLSIFVFKTNPDTILSQPQLRDILLKNLDLILGDHKDKWTSGEKLDYLTNFLRANALLLGIAALIFVLFFVWCVLASIYLAIAFHLEATRPAAIEMPYSFGAGVKYTRLESGKGNLA